MCRERKNTAPIIFLPVFTRPTSMSYGANTPPLSILDDYSSFPEGSQSSIDLSHVNYMLSNTLTLFRTLPRAKSNHVLATTVTNDRSLNKYNDREPFSVFAVLCGSITKKQKIIEDLEAERALALDKDAMLDRSKKREAELEEEIVALHADLDVLDSQLDRALRLQKEGDEKHETLHIAFDQAAENLVRMMMKGQQNDWRDKEAELSDILLTQESSMVQLQQEQQALQKANEDLRALVSQCDEDLAHTKERFEASEPLTRISFSAYPTCHDVNPSTASSERLDVNIGFSTGDLICFANNQTHYQATTAALINRAPSPPPSAQLSVGSPPPQHSLVSHANRTIIVYDKERDHGLFTASIPNGLTNTPHINVNVHHTSPVSDGWDPLSTMFVTPPPWHPEATGRGEKGVVAKNPVSHWRLCRRGVVTAISEDGCLRVIDPLAEQPVDCYASYFESLTCVTWSPDGHFILVRFTPSSQFNEHL
ncbi:hypothetical protein EDD22DRAFT_986565 [Suillus occidentalis]|nr:hypothetical protein EDD22DRAFT_986565 [Suillus occidentalis]